VPAVIPGNVLRREENLFDPLSENTCDVEGQGRLGSYLPVSMALMVWRETRVRSASSAWDQPLPARNTLIAFLTGSACSP
jgi:hypothetical protein